MINFQKTSMHWYLTEWDSQGHASVRVHRSPSPLSDQRSKADHQWCPSLDTFEILENKQSQPRLWTPPKIRIKRNSSHVCPGKLTKIRLDFWQLKIKFNLPHDKEWTYLSCYAKPILHRNDRPWSESLRHDTGIHYTHIIQMSLREPRPMARSSKRTSPQLPIVLY